MLQNMWILSMINDKCNHCPYQEVAICQNDAGFNMFQYVSMTASVALDVT